MWCIISKETFQAFQLHISFWLLYFTKISKWRLKYDDKNENFVNLWTVKSLNKGLASHQFVYHCKQQLFNFLSMSFVLLLMFNTSQEQAKYNISTQFQLRKMWGSISLAAGVGYLTVIGQREKNDTSPHYLHQATVHIKVITAGGILLNYPPLVRSQPITDLECRNPWSYVASFWYFASSWLI